jgi:hypothetical protein
MRRGGRARPLNGASDTHVISTGRQHGRPRCNRRAVSTTRASRGTRDSYRACLSLLFIGLLAADAPSAFAMPEFWSHIVDWQVTLSHPAPLPQRGPRG